MDITTAGTVVAAFAAMVADDPARPLVTYYDDAIPERAELSGATVANWVAKTANLLVDGCGLGHGDTAAIRLPAHWQTAVVLLGCWSAGLSVDLRRMTGDPAITSTTSATAVSVAFASADRLGDVAAAETFALALAPLAQPFWPGPPAGTHDFVLQVRGHGDHFAPSVPVRPATQALADGTAHADVVISAAARADAAGIGASSRVLVDADAHADPLDWFLAPLVVNASIVLCRHLDRARLAERLARERATPFLFGEAHS